MADPRINQARRDRNLEKAKRRDAEQQRDQLLEGIEAHRAELAHGVTANHDFADYETHIATARIDHQFTNNVSLRNTLRFANYKRESESTISTLSATDANGAPVTPVMNPNILAIGGDLSMMVAKTDDEAVKRLGVGGGFFSFGIHEELKYVK